MRVILGNLVAIPRKYSSSHPTVCFTVVGGPYPDLFMSNQQAMTNTPTEVIKHMMQQLQTEVELATKVGRDTQEGRAHLFRARNLKMQLINMQMQMQQRRQSQQASQVPGGASSADSQQISTPQLASPQAGAQQLPGGAQGLPPLPPSVQAASQGSQGSQGPGALPSGMPQLPHSVQQAQQLRMAQMAQMAQMGPLKPQGSNQGSPGPPGAANFAQQASPAAATPAVNVAAGNGFQQRFAQIDELRRTYTQLLTRIQQVEVALRTHTEPAKLELFQQQLQYLQSRREQVRQREQLILRELRQAVGRPRAQQAPANTQNPTQVPNGQQPAAGMQAAMLRGVPRTQDGQPVTQNQVTAARAAQLRAMQHAGTPSSPAGANPPALGAQGANLPAGSSPATAGPTATGPDTPRAFAQNMPIPAHLNVAPPVPASVRSGRPTLTNGGASDAHALNNPALVRAPTLDLSGDRLLSKRKLGDLVGSIMGNDNEPLIDGDVEELLLDLADEFVQSVTAFACKLAKHRKSDVLDAKDIHLHLERNWNMHIAGYSSDEIRSIRRFLPTQTYQQKLQGIGMAKTVNK